MREDRPAMASVAATMARVTEWHDEPGGPFGIMLSRAASLPTLTRPRSSEVNRVVTIRGHDLEQEQLPASFSRPSAGSPQRRNPRSSPLWLSGTAQAASHAAICLAFST